MQKGYKHFLINQESDYPVRFFDATGTEQTTLADIRDNATVMDIRSYGKFKLNEIRDVVISRGFKKTNQVSSLTEGNLNVTAPSTGFVNVYFNFIVKDFSYSSSYARHAQNFGFDKRYQVVLVPTDTTNTVAAKLFNQMDFEQGRYPSPQDLPVKATIPSGRIVSGTYVDGTSFSTVTLTSEHTSDVRGGALTQDVREFSVIDGGASDPLLTFTGNSTVGGREEIVFTLKVEGDDFNLIQTNVSAVLTNTQSQSQGRSNTAWLEANWVLRTDNTSLPYFNTFNDQLPQASSLYTNITFSTDIERYERGSAFLIDTVSTSRSLFDIMLLENSINLNATTGLITKIAAFLTKDGKAVNGYTLYNQDFGNPASATRDSVLSGNDATAWDESTHSGVVRTGIDGVTAQNVNDVADLVDDVQSS